MRAYSRNDDPAKKEELEEAQRQKWLKEQEYLEVRQQGFRNSPQLPFFSQGRKVQPLLGLLSANNEVPACLTLTLTLPYPQRRALTIPHSRSPQP